MNANRAKNNKPFDLCLAAESEDKYAGRIFVLDRTGNENNYIDKLTINGLDIEHSGGMRIGTSTKYENGKNALEVVKGNIEIQNGDLSASKKIIAKVDENNFIQLSNGQISGKSPNAICDGTSQGVSGGGYTQTLGNSFTIHAPKITLQSNGRPKIEDDSTTFTYSMPEASDISYGGTNVSEKLTDLSNQIAAIKRDYLKTSEADDKYLITNIAISHTSEVGNVSVAVTQNNNILSNSTTIVVK